MVKENIQKMAEEIGMKKESLEFGLKQNEKYTTDAIKKAHDFMQSGGKKK